MGCLGGRTAGDVGPSVDEHPCNAICGGSMSPAIESGSSCRLSQQRLAQASGRSAEPEGTWNWPPCGGCASSTTSEYARAYRIYPPAEAETNYFRLNAGMEGDPMEQAVCNLTRAAQMSRPWRAYPRKIKAARRGVDRLGPALHALTPRCAHNPWFPIETRNQLIARPTNHEHSRGTQFSVDAQARRSRLPRKLVPPCSSRLSTYRRARRRTPFPQTADRAHPVHSDSS
ncbi:hypothetical protein LMG19087_02879 [Ralstonia wenshanensis]|nr:hypothetical protein LMG19087_02879 [Ralstonia wenshanensis]